MPAQRQFFSSCEIDFSGTAETRPLLEQSHLSEAAAKALAAKGQECAFVDFDEGGAARSGGYIPWPDCALTKKPDALRNFGGPALTALSSPPKQLAYWAPDANGASRLGGPAPNWLNIPEASYPRPDCSFRSGFHFIGMISREEPGLEGWGCDVPLLYPTFLHAIPPTFWDMSNIANPRLFPFDQCGFIDSSSSANPVSWARFGWDLEEVPDVEQVFSLGGSVIWNEQRLTKRFCSVADFARAPLLADASHPSWIQSPCIPLCPRTGAPMSFLGQFEWILPIQSFEMNNGTTFAETTVLGEFISVLGWNDIADTVPIYVFHNPIGRSVAMLSQWD